MPLYLSYEDTTRLDIKMREVLDLFEEAHKLLAAEQGVYTPRTRLVYPSVSGKGQGRPWKQNLRILPAILAGWGAGLRVGAKKAREKGSGGGLLVFFDFETMKLKAMISDFLIHGLRSGAPDGVAAKYLSRVESTTLGIIGSGRIAQWATRAVCAVRPIRNIKVFSPTPGHRKDYARTMEQKLQIQVSDYASAEPVVSNSHVIVTATNTTTGPVLKGEWLTPGCTIICNTPEELDVSTIRCAKRIVVGLREEVFSHTPPYQAITDLLSSGEIKEADLSLEIGDIIMQRKPGRTSEDEIIAYLNPGCGIYDVAIAAYVFRKAKEQGLGTFLPA
ncbi:MAG: ornithine cyclodeaminase family protein [Candidatus Binatia bacterium]